MSLGLRRITSNRGELLHCGGLRESDHQIGGLSIVQPLRPRERAPRVEAERVPNRHGQARPSRFSDAPSIDQTLPYLSDEVTPRAEHGGQGREPRHIAVHCARTSSARR